MCIEEEFCAVYSKYFDEDDEEILNDTDRSEDGTSNSDDNEPDISQAEDEEERTFNLMDLSAIDVKEEELINEFLSKDCCKKKCHSVIPRKMITNTRNNCRCLFDSCQPKKIWKEKR